MFVRVDKDLSININNIFSYKLSEDLDSFKLQVWGLNGTPIHTILYLKERPDQMQLLIDFNNTMRDLTVNNEIVRYDNTEEVEKRIEEKIEHIEE